MENERNKDSDVFARYRRGEVTTGMDWTEDLPNAWVLTEELRNERATAQLGLDGELYFKKVHPVVERTPEQEHLARVSEKPKSVLPMAPRLPETPAQYEPDDATKLALVRHQLNVSMAMGGGGAGLSYDAQSINAGEMRE